MGNTQKESKDATMIFRMTFGITGDSVEMIDHKVVEDVRDLEETEEEKVLSRITLGTTTLTLSRG